MKKVQVLSIILAILLILAGCSTQANDVPDYKSLFETDAREAEILWTTDDYVLVFYTGTGPSLQLYKVTASGSTASILSSATGGHSISGCISINHLEADGKHIYFGTLTDSHWTPSDDTVIEAAWDELSMISQSGESCVMDVSSSSGYICILDAPLADFKAANSSGEAFLDMATFCDQGYPIEDTALTAYP